MDIVKLDLHGTRHADVERKVIRLIEAHWGQNVELEIITGHSNKMKSIVCSVLDEYKLAYSVGRLTEKSAPKIIAWLE